MMTHTKLPVLALTLAVGCGAPPREGTGPLAPTEAEPGEPEPTIQKSAALNRIMKERVNTPFSRLTFFVFHADGDLDFDEASQLAAQLNAGVSAVRSFPRPPVVTPEARDVFDTLLGEIDRDSAKLTGLIASRDIDAIRMQLGKVSRTCNACHHFFRLRIEDAPER